MPRSEVDLTARTDHRPLLEAPRPLRPHRPESGGHLALPRTARSSPAELKASHLSWSFSALVFPPGYLSSRHLQAGHTLRCCGSLLCETGDYYQRPGADDDSSWVFPAQGWQRDTKATGGPPSASRRGTRGRDQRSRGWGARTCQAQPGRRCSPARGGGPPPAPAPAQSATQHPGPAWNLHKGGLGGLGGGGGCPRHPQTAAAR